MCQNDRLFKVIGYVDTIHDMCALLGCDFYLTIREVHPTLDESVSSQVKSITNETISRLGSTIQSLRDEKKRRMQKVSIQNFSL
jgi:protein regulator of cytokinesis 1